MPPGNSIRRPPRPERSERRNSSDLAASTAPAVISRQAASIVRLGCGEAGGDQHQRRQQRRGIARRAQHLDVAMLDAMVPGIEGGTHRHQPEAKHGEPLSGALRQHGFFQREMAGQRKHRGGRAEPRDDAGRHFGKAPRRQRIGRPHEGADAGHGVAEDIAAVERDAAAIGDDQDVPASPSMRAGHVIPRSRSPGISAEPSTMNSGHK